MNKLFFIIIIFSFMIVSNLSFSSNVSVGKFVVAKNYLPLEFQYLVSFLQKNKLPPEELNELMAKINYLDQCAMHLEQRDYIFLIKSEILKKLLKHRPRHEVPKEFISANTLTRLSSYIDQNAGKLSLFPHWFAEALRADLVELTQDSLFRPLERHAQGPMTTIPEGMKRLHHRLMFILPWISFIITNPPEMLENKLLPIAQLTMEELALSCQSLMHLSNRSIKSSSEHTLVHFKIQSQSTDSVLDQIFEILDLEKMGITERKDEGRVLQWIPKDEPKKLLPIEGDSATTQKPSKEYVSPEKLPVPLNDWNIDLD